MDKEPRISISVTVNGALVEAEAPARESLADFLRPPGGADRYPRRLRAGHLRRLYGQV